MRNSTLALLIALPMLGTGCSFTQAMRRNVAVAPMISYTEKMQVHRSELLGREAFRQMALQYPDQEFSCDYRKGFVDGFQDYLDFGGTGEPPPVPAVKYRSFSYMTPEGLAAMEDWKLGWRHGAATAKVSNLRELNTFPIHWGPVYSTDPPKPGQQSRLSGDGATPLPAPRKVDEAADAEKAKNEQKVEAPKPPQ